MVRPAHLPSLQVGEELAKRRRNSEIPLAFERFRVGNWDAAMLALHPNLTGKKISNGSVMSVA
jgi:hypothetical protein